MITELIKSLVPLSLSLFTPTFTRERNVCKSCCHLNFVASITQAITLLLLLLVYQPFIQTTFFGNSPPLLNVVQDIHQRWPDDLRLSYNGSTLIATTNTNTNTNTNKQVPSVQFHLPPGSSSAEMFQLMMGLQDQVVPDLLPGDPRSKSSLSSFSSSSLVQVHTHAYNISMLLDQSNVKYITSSGRRDLRKYEYTDHAAHLIARSLCKIQKIKDKQSQTGSLFTFVCSKKMITSKLNALKQSKGHHKGTVLWRMVTNTMETSEKFALKVLLRTLMLGTLCTLVELWFMVISVATIAWIIGRRFLRVPTLGQTPVTQRLSLWQLHHVAAYISFPSILIGKIVVTL